MDFENNVENKIDSLKVFEEDFKFYLDKLNAINNREELKTYIKNDFIVLISSFKSLGNEAVIEHSSPTIVNLVNYVLSEDFKTVLLLHRDVFLELNKATISYKESQSGKNQISEHFKKSKAILIQNLEDFYSLYISGKDEMSKQDYTKKLAKKIALQKNPWYIYIDQYDLIIDQIKLIDNQTALAHQTLVVFDKLKQSVTELTSNHRALITRINESENSILEQAKNGKSNDELKNLVDEQITKQSEIVNNAGTFSERINVHINALQKVEIPVSAQNGLIAIREIDLKKRVQKWFDYQFLPELVDLIALETSVVNKYSLNLLNLKNNLLHSRENKDDAQLNTLIGTLTQLRGEISDLASKSEIITSSLNDKANNELLVTNIILGKPFLDVTLNSSLNVESNTIYKKLKSKFQKSTSYFNSQYKKSLQYESTSNVELSTQCIAHRMYQDKSTHYDSLFLNKNFIGDLFLVPRRIQEEKLKSIIDQWNKGFSKSVLIYGDRLSGRSTFMDYSAKKFFGKDIVFIKPDSDAIIDGRKFRTTYNLKEALTYLKNNNTKSTRPVVLLDDIELWRDEKHSLVKNIRALINFIETESDDAFVMVSTTNMMKNHIDQRLSFSQTFSNVINVDDADAIEIVDAILLRHGAAHRDLISEKLELIAEHKIRQLAHKISKKQDYNFGNALQSWTYNTFVQDDDRVVFKESYYEFLDFFTSQEVIILKQALLFKFITEYGIKRVTSSAFESEFKSAMRRLLNTKVFLRENNGLLYINPVVVNDVTGIVNHKTNI